ncbi:MAG: hypothetical protein D8M58_17920 [Calditrichaeota bacterium]|nr:MAG: hypothetical protein DWQ03_01835 [Calditrichota bacterium]MBL1207286.1 hypothetical protein [Calditrichota bacterium]NOG47118.1 hypothetical protein [Calditrichota bacterium]
MNKQKIDPFFLGLGKALGVPPDKIGLKHSKFPGEITCIGPKPKLKKEFPELPYEFEYCFTWVIKIAPPHFLCNAWREEYDDLKQQLPALINSEQWEEVQIIVEKLKSLRIALDGCRVRERVITYCIFPV